MQNDKTTMIRTGSNWLHRVRAAGAALLASLACTLALAQGVTITSPAPGAVVYPNKVDVSGTFSGTNLTVISVYNGVNSTVLAAPRAANATTYTAPAVPIFPGNNTLTVTALQRDGTSTTATVTITNPYLGVVMTSPLKGTAYTSPPTSLTLQASALAMPANVQRVEYRLLTGAVIGTATTPPYTYTWNGPPSQSFTVFARMFDDAGRSTDSSGIPVTITAPNQPPVVSLTVPTNGASYTAPANITLQASASDPDGTVSLVEFLNNGNLLGATNTPPYSFALSGQPAGSYSFTARATDNQGAMATSAPASVTVTANTPPTVGLTSPAAGSSYLVPANIQVSADAVAAAGSITKVDFAATRSGATPVTATATSPPYTATLPITQGGAYTLTATAYDSNGASATSSAVAVSVSDGITYLHNDFAGSPIAATDSTGAVVWKENYQPYGSRNNNPPAEAGNRIAFHGKPQDQETGLSYFGARYYDPVIGRFMGVDAVRFNEDNLQSFNRYAYGNNNPYRFIDPDGNEAVEIRSPEWMRAVVPGQVIWDNARTALANGNYSSAAVLTLGMAAEIGGTVVTGGTTKGVAVVAGQAGKFGKLAGVVGDDLTAHHMPQAALNLTGRAEGGALVMTTAEHKATRTYGAKGAITAIEDAGTNFRVILAKDIRDVRSIVGSKYNEGLQDLTKYYRENFPNLIGK